MVSNGTTNQLRPAEQYNYALTLNGPEFGWEFLRRDQTYQTEYRVKNPTASAPALSSRNAGLAGKPVIRST